MARALVLAFWLVVFFLARSSQAEEHVVLHKNKLFSPSEITIKPGDGVVFKNEDDVVHNAFSVTKGSEFNLNIQGPGQSASFVFPHEGKIEVRCVMHPAMKLIINVKK
jgi:plastocyanin